MELVLRISAEVNYSMICAKRSDIVPQKGVSVLVERSHPTLKYGEEDASDGRYVIASSRIAQLRQPSFIEGKEDTV